MSITNTYVYSKKNIIIKALFIDQCPLEYCISRVFCVSQNLQKWGKMCSIFNLHQSFFVIFIILL